jgi:hypothetical protein
VLTSLNRALHRWLRKILTFLLIAGLSLVALATWIFLQDPVDPVTSRERVIQEVNTRLELQRAAAREAGERLQSLRSEFTAQEERLGKCVRIIDSLHALESRWERWFGNREQQRINAARLEHLEALQQEIRGRIAELNRDIRRAEFEDARAQRRIQATEFRLTELEYAKWPAIYYLDTAWQRAKWIVAAGALLYFLGGAVARGLLFLGVPRVVARSHPLRLAKGSMPTPVTSAATTALEIALWPGEILRIRRNCYLSSELGVAKRSAFFLDAQIPLTSMLCGVWRVFELHRRQAGGVARVEVAAEPRTGTELIAVNIPDGGSLLVRPSAVVGLIRSSADKLVVHRRWSLFHLAAWAHFQFRYFEFQGPCRLVVAGRRSMRAERLAPSQPNERASRRIPRDAVIGFSPTLNCQAVRASRFWAYCRGKVPLFDALLEGEGIVLIQEGLPRTRSVRRQLGRLRNRALRMVGL